jgi:hypothetical protein
VLAVNEAITNSLERRAVPCRSSGKENTLYLFICLFILHSRTKDTQDLFVVHKLAVGQVFLEVPRFSPVSINPPLLDIHNSCYFTRALKILAVDNVAK